MSGVTQGQHRIILAKIKSIMPTGSQLYFNFAHYLGILASSNRLCY